MTISSAFVTAANSAGATAKERFAQSRLLKGEPSKDARKGICGGLSLTFLGLYAKNGAKSLTEAKEHSWSALLEYSLKLQHMVMAVPGGVTTVAQAMMVNFCKAAPIVGLRGDGLIASHRWPAAGAMSRTILNRPASYVIALPNHYLGAAFDGTNTAFFDPNAGVAYCEGTASFTAMINFFFTNPEVTTAYECSGADVLILPFAAA